MSHDPIGVITGATPPHEPVGAAPGGGGAIPWWVWIGPLALLAPPLAVGAVGGAVVAKVIEKTEATREDARKAVFRAAILGAIIGSVVVANVGLDLAAKVKGLSK